MGASCNSVSGLPSGRMAASDGSSHVAPHAPATAHSFGVAKRNIVQIFKKTPCFPGLKPSGRDVAKDRYDLGGIPLLKQTLLDYGHFETDDLTVTGRPIAETLTSANNDPHQGLGRAEELLQGEAGARTLDVKLTDKEPAEHETKWKARDTNPTSDVLWTVGPGVDGAAAHLGAAYEKQCYADI